MVSRHFIRTSLALCALIAAAHQSLLSQIRGDVFRARRKTHTKTTIKSMQLKGLKLTPSHPPMAYGWQSLQQFLLSVAGRQHPSVWPG